MNRAHSLTRTADVSLRRSIRRAFVAWHTLNVRLAAQITRLVASLPSSREVQDSVIGAIAFCAFVAILYTL